MSQEGNWKILREWLKELQEHFLLESKVTLHLNSINILSNFQTDKQINPNCLDFLKRFTE